MKTVKIILVGLVINLIIAGGIVGCGQRGELYLPDNLAQPVERHIKTTN